MVEIGATRAEDDDDKSSSSEDEEDLLYGKDKKPKKKQEGKKGPTKSGKPSESNEEKDGENEYTFKEDKETQDAVTIEIRTNDSNRDESSAPYPAIGLRQISLDIKEDSEPHGHAPRDRRSVHGVVFPEAAGKPTVFDPLPDEVMVRIYSHLDVPSIGKLSQVCKRFKDLSEDLPMWKELATKRSYLTHSTGISNMKEATKSFYIRKFKSFRRRQEASVQLEKQRQKEAVRQKSIRECTLFMLASGFARPYEWIVTICIVLVTIFAVLKLDGVVDWGWFYIFIPLYFCVLHMLYVPILYDIASSYYNKDFEDDMSPERHPCCSPVFYFMMFIVTLGINSNKTKRILVYSFAVTSSAFIMMWAVKVGFYMYDGVLPWWAVFLPLLLEIAIVIGVLIFGGGRMDPVWWDDTWIDRVLPIFVLLFLFLFFLFSHLKLDGYVDWSWYQVMIPLFILKGLLVFIPLCLTLFTACAGYSTRRKSRWHKESGVFCMMSIVMIVLLLVPLLTFEILLAQRAENANDLKYKLIFTPIFIIEGCSVVGCVALNIMALTAD